MNAIEFALNQYLDDGLAAPVYLHEAPQEEVAPFVVFAVVERADIRGTAPLLTAGIETAAVAVVHEEAEALGAALRVLLEGWKYGAPGVRLGPLALANVDNGFDSDLGKYRVTISWAAQAVLF
jgi:hypothetical protein